MNLSIEFFCFLAFGVMNNFLGTFLLICYNIKLCQKDIVENHLKTLVLAKSLN
jgi:hypothetical protein